MKKLILISLFPILAGCVNDGISMRIDGPDHAVSLLRAQKLFWENRADLEVVVSRLPNCQRRYKLQSAAIGPGFKVDVYALGQNSFLLEQGKHLYTLETQTCQKFEKLTEPPQDGKGELVGTFREQDGKLAFVQTAQAEAKEK